MKVAKPGRPAGFLGCACLFLMISAGVRAGETLLLDDFHGYPLDTSVWGLATWNIGDRTQFGNTPVFASESGIDYVSLPLDTYNPNSPGQRVLGTEIYSLKKFDNPDGVEFLAKARLRTLQPGLVAAFFTYDEQRRKGRWLSDEIDFEVLSSQQLRPVLATSWNDWGAAGSDYGDGVHHLGGFLDLPGFDWQAWNDYAMRWYPDRVEWWVNGDLVQTNFSAIPDMPQPVRASLWAGGTTWPDAFHPSLVPVSTPGNNQRFYWDIDYILVTRLGGGGSGGGELPAAPVGLAASVTKDEVRLSWTDMASNETAYTVYRAWQPKGKAAPDFKAIASSLAANTTSYVDRPGDGNFLYRVTASNGTGESAPSNTVTVSVGSGGKGGKPGSG